MRFMATIAMLFAFASLASAQDKRQQVLDGVAQLAAQVQELKAAQSKKLDPPSLPIYESVYMNLMRDAAKRNRIAVVFVGHDGTVLGRDLGGNVSSGRADKVEGYPAKCVIVAEPDGFGWMNHKATLGPNATDAQLQAAIKGVSLAASFFGQSNGKLRPGEVRIVDVEQSWPVGLTFLNDLEPYRPATRTQQSFRIQSGYIASVPRNVLEQKWVVPGNLVGVHGWASTLYRSKGDRTSEGVGPSRVNGMTHTHQRKYVGDVIRADVLRNEQGKIFEVRVAEKSNGQWERFIAFKDVSARPYGYHPPTRQECVACHSQAGVTAYAGPAIPGDDTVISDPIYAVESGNTEQGNPAAFGGGGMSMGGRRR